MHSNSVISVKSWLLEEKKANRIRPNRERTPTNTFCFKIFVLFLITWAAIGLYASQTGNVETFFTPSDGEGRKCGRDAPYLLEFHSGNDQSNKVCRKACPSKDFNYANFSHRTNLTDAKKKMICVSEKYLGRVDSWEKLDKLVAMGECARKYWKTEPIDDVCVVLETKRGFDIREILLDVKNSWRLVLLVITASGFLSLGYIALLQSAAKPLFYGSICFISGFICFSFSSDDWINGGSIALLCSTISICGLIVYVFFKKRVDLACQLIKESSKAIKGLPSTLPLSIIPVTLQLFVALLAATIGLYLCSIGSPAYSFKVFEDGKCLCSSGDYRNNSACNPEEFNKFCREDNESCVSATCRFVGIKPSKLTILMHGVNVLAFYWLSSFIVVLQQLILAGAFATWYWTHRKSHVTFSVVTESVFRVFNYHLGTAALGSLLNTICELIRYLLEAEDNRKEDVNGMERKKIVSVVRGLLQLMLDGFVRVFCRDAYIMCAIHGRGLFRSGLDAVNLMKRNIMRFFVLNKITGFMLWMGQIVVVILAGLITWYFLDAMSTQPMINEWIPIVLAVTGAYLTSDVFFSVQTVAVDTVFLCFLEDSEHEENHSSDSYYMSSNLRKILRK